jgi:26S proteasome non-ATPase regulatory subunit 9
MSASSSTSLPATEGRGGDRGEEHTTTTADLLLRLEALKTLIAEKRRQQQTVEASKVEATLTLQRNANVGLKGRLVDDEGFPRADIDVYAVRQARHTLATMANDEKAVCDELMTALEELHSIADELEKRGALPASAGSRSTKRATSAEAGSSSAVSASSHPVAAGAGQQQRPSDPHHLREFVSSPVLFAVTDVAARSPASDAGLRAGDLILKFGPIETAADAARLSSVVVNSEGMPLMVVVRRVAEDSDRSGRRSGGELVDLTLVPQRWGGKGLLGCSLAPV